MTVTQALAIAHGLRGQVYEDEQCLRWLEELDGQLATELHGILPPSYHWPEDEGRELAVPPPYDRLYPLYLLAMTDFAQRDNGGYANSAALYTEALGAYRRAYRRGHLPPATALRL